MSLARNVVLSLGGAGAAGYLVYFATQQQIISRHESEVNDWEKLVGAEQKAITSSTKQIAEQEARMKQLAEHEQREQAAQQDTETRLQEARELVARLEAEYNAKQASAAKAAADGKTAGMRLRNLVADAARAREALAVGEQSLKVARQRTWEAQKLVNPLNHPRVKELMGSR